MRLLQQLWIARHPEDPVAGAPPVRAALAELEAALAGHGISLHEHAEIAQVPAGEACLLVAGRDAGPARALLNAAGVAFPADPESLGLVPVGGNGRSLLLACGSDSRGLAYAVLELADRVLHAEQPAGALAIEAPLVERPANPIRSVTRLFTSELEDKPWFDDREFWRRYLAMLVSQRFNRFSLTLGLGYNRPSQIRDAYFYFPYPFLVAVPGYEVRAAGLPEEEREQNLATLRFISDEASARGLQFQLGLWSHAYEWSDSPDATYRIDGLTPELHAAYCRDALRGLLEACPAIQGITFRVHGESGIPEGNDGFWRTVFDGVTHCGRRIEIDLHSKGLDQGMIEVALATGLPVTVSPKYSAEHMGLPYQQASIRELERLPRENLRDGLMALSGGSRRFTRYSHGDLLREDRRYGVFYRIWPGTQRVLLWGDPVLAAGYGRHASFCGCLGVEICEPLTFKGRMGSGQPGGREGYLDPSLRPDGGDWEKHRYTYRLFGRLLYNPDADPETWRRFLRKEFGDGAPAAEAALAAASRVLPLATTAYHPSASNNAYWPEIYTSLPIVKETRSPYSDTPSPRRFGAASALDPELFARVDDFADELLRGEVSGRVSPLEVARWLDGFCETAERRLAEAEARVDDRGVASFRRWAIDTSLQTGLGRFFAGKLRAGVWYALFERTQDEGALNEALSAYRAAREAWATLSGQAESVYARDLTFGLSAHLRGHWSDRLAAIDSDLRDMEGRRGDGATGGRGAGEQGRRRDSDGAGSARRFLALLDARDPQAWRCEHTPPVAFQRGEALAIEATVQGAGGGDGSLSMRLHYRHVNQAETYVVEEMRPGGGRYRATIPGDYTASPYPLQYFLRLRDAQGRAWLHPGFEPDLTNQPYYVVRAAPGGAP